MRRELKQALGHVLAGQRNADNFILS